VKIYYIIDKLALSPYQSSSNSLVGTSCGQTDKANFRVPFSPLHGMQMQSSDETSVSLSVQRVDCDKTEERSVQIFIPYERSFSLVF